MYRIWPHSEYQPKSWTFEGSEDDISWNTLDTQSNITNWEIPTTNSITNLTEMKQFIFENNTAYRHYRINILEAWENDIDDPGVAINSVRISELALYSCEFALKINLTNSTTIQGISNENIDIATNSLKFIKNETDRLMTFSYYNTNYVNRITTLSYGPDIPDEQINTSISGNVRYKTINE